MDKNAIKKYAVWARRELIERVSQRALIYGISADAQADANAVIVNGLALDAVQQKQRKALIEQIKEKGYEQVMEEVAYTWFNRFAALRFMEVNGYLPSHIRVFTDDDGAFRPQILTEAIHLELDGLDMEKVYALERENKKEELFKYLLIVQCNALSNILPGMFQKIEDYTELLLPDYLLREGSVIEQMVTMIPEEDWTDQVQIIGWLYQYYNTEPKDQVFADLKKNIKISKEKIPAATQLFTPDWIVHYMVENSLGRLWIEGHPDSAASLLPSEEEQTAYAAGESSPGDTKWHYYLEEAEQELEVEAQLKEIWKEYAALKPEEILCIDPCMGSGHILCVLFDVLVRIYEDYGYTAREAAVSIVQNNLWGLDIDDRAAQLAYFAVMMKARQYDRRFFSRHIQPHVYAIAESNHVSADAVGYFCNGDAKLERAMQTIITELHDAKEYGSILTTTPQDWNALYARFDEIRDDISIYKDATLMLESLVQTAQSLGQKYWVIATNPPYMGSRSYSGKIAKYVQKYFPDSKMDLYAVFIERCSLYAKHKGFVAMITMHAFMFLASFESLRFKYLNNNIISAIHLGIKAFDEIGNDVVQTVSFVHRIANVRDYTSTFCRLVEIKNQLLKKEDFLARKHLFRVRSSEFLRIPGYTIAYWVPQNFIDNFTNHHLLGENIYFPSLNKTGDNDRFLRYWWEVDKTKIGIKWRHYSKGGNFRRYYGNIDTVIDWSESARDFYKTNPTSNMVNEKFWYKEGITYSAVTSRGTGFRYLPSGCLYDMGGPAIFVTQNLYGVLALLNSNVASYYFNVLNPTINLQTKDIKALPTIFGVDDTLEDISKRNVELAKLDWDSYETSDDFLGLSLSEADIQLEYESYHENQLICAKEFDEHLHAINKMFADLYKLSLDILPKVEERDGAVTVIDRQGWVKDVVSYAVGCMFGRYSLDEEGLAYAGGEWDASKYKTFPADKDAIIPICDDEYFTDDIVGLFVKFIETVYGTDTLEENLRFIADALGTKGSTSREVIRNYFLNDFYKDHLKTYQKRPIYWLFDSGKKNGFKCLIYMHRYQPDMIARIRTDYVHEQQSRYRTAIADLEQRVNNASASERVKLNKQLQKLQGQNEEVRDYEEKIHHLADQFIAIDLDDGVKVNYAKFQDVLAKIR